MTIIKILVPQLLMYCNICHLCSPNVTWCLFHDTDNYVGVYVCEQYVISTVMSCISNFPCVSVGASRFISASSQLVYMFSGM